MNDDNPLRQYGLLSFQKIDAMKGIRPRFLDTPLPEAEGGITVEQWYVGIYATPFQDLSDEDLSKVCSQGWERESTIPLAIARLQERPFIGRYNDGELLLALGGTPARYWQEHSDMHSAFCQVIERVISLLYSALMAGDDTIDAYPEVYMDDETRDRIFQLPNRLSCS